MCDHIKRNQSRSGNAQVGTPTAAIDNRTGREYRGSKLFQDANHFTGAPTGSHNILHHGGAYARFDRKPAAQCHPARSVAFREYERCPQRARDFMADDQAAERGSDNQTDAARGRQSLESRREPAAQFFSVRWMLQHQRRLQIFGAVQPAGQAKMSGEICARAPKQLKDAIGLRRHERLLYH